MKVLNINSIQKQMGKIGKCQLCDKHKRLIKAHVISRTLFKDIFKEFGPAQSVSVNNIDNAYRVQDAFFDTGILCGECDNLFSPFETYFSSLLKKSFSNRGITLAGKLHPPGQQYSVDIYKGVDTYKIRMFYLILLWRSSISKYDSFKHVALSKAEIWLRKEIGIGISADFDIFPATLLSFEEVDDIRVKSVVPPLRFNLENTSVLFFYLYGFALVYFLEDGSNTTLYQHRLRKNEDFRVVKLNQKLGEGLLDLITRTNSRIKLSTFINPYGRQEDKSRESL